MLRSLSLEFGIRLEHLVHQLNVLRVIEPACGGNLASKLFVAHLAVATHAESGALHRVSGFLGERP